MRNLKSAKSNGKIIWDSYTKAPLVCYKKVICIKYILKTNSRKINIFLLLRGDSWKIFFYIYHTIVKLFFSSPSKVDWASHAS